MIILIMATPQRWSWIAKAAFVSGSHRLGEECAAHNYGNICSSPKEKECACDTLDQTLRDAGESYVAALLAPFEPPRSTERGEENF